MTEDAELEQVTVEGEVPEPEGHEPAEETEDPEALRAELEAARNALAEEQERVAKVQAELATSLTRYRDAMLAGAPDVPPELVQGDTVAALDEAFAQAQGLVQRVQQQVEARVSRERVPAGAPARSAADLSSLSPQEKIMLGLRQLQE